MTQEQIDKILKVAPWLNDAEFENTIISIDSNFIKWKSDIQKNGS